MAVLKRGAKGKDVEALQTALNKEIKAGLAVDGQFGKQTEAALKKYQKKKSLKNDGVAGPSTQAVIGIGAKVRVTKPKIGDVTAMLRDHKAKGGADGLFPPAKFKEEFKGVQGFLKDIEKQFMALVTQSEALQKDVLRHHAKMTPVLEQMVALQAEHAKATKANPVRAADIGVELASLNTHLEKLRGLRSTAQTRQLDLFMKKFVPLLEKIAD